MAGGLDGRPPNVEGASQPIHGQGGSRRNTTLVSHSNVWSCTSMCESKTKSLHPGRHAGWKHALVGSEGRLPARRPPASPDLTSQVNPGGAADDPARCAHVRLRAHTCGSGPGRQTTTIHSIASLRVWRLQVERAPRSPHTGWGSRQSGGDGAHVWQESRDDVLARHRGIASGQDHYTGRWHHGQESGRAIGNKTG